MKYFFITGMGRSGTKFLSTLLNQASEVQVEHEFIGNREFAILSNYLDSNNYTIPYLNRFKNRIIKEVEEGKHTFIDVNGGLRNCVLELKMVFRSEKIFHLVRNPKKVVRSYYLRRNENSVHQIPKNKEDNEWWLDADKFSRICWNWNNTTQNLLAQNTHLIRFEDLIANYNYLYDNILKPCQIDINESKWKEMRSIRVNKTKSRFKRFLYAKFKGKEYVEDSLPQYENWSIEYKDVFEKICGDTMRELGYN